MSSDTYLAFDGRDWRKDLQQRAADSTSRYLDRLDQINGAIGVISQVLTKHQPKHEGSLKIVWDHRQIYPAPYPSLMECKKGANETWWYERCQQKNLVLRAKKRGAFAAGHVHVKVVLEILSELLKQRTRILRSLSYFSSTADAFISKTDASNEEAYTQIFSILAPNWRPLEPEDVA